MAQIRQEINILTHLQQQSVDPTDVETGALDTSQYDGTVTYYFEIVVFTSVSATVAVTLRRKGTSTDDATINVPLGTTADTLIRSASFTPPASALTEYITFIGTPSAGDVTIRSARIIIIQSNFTKTETHIEIAGTITNFNSVSFAVYTQPKYWKYTSANWDGTIVALWEVTLNSGTTKATASAELQVADGTGDGFVGWAAVGSDLTSATGAYTRVRSGTITLTAGRNYRVVVKTSSTKTTVTGATCKIIIRQSASPTKFELQYLLAGLQINAGTGLQPYHTKWDSTEWSSVTNSYFSCFDSANGSTNVIELDTIGGVQITNSVVTNPDNQGISSSAMTMPADGTITCKATTNNGTVHSARILVVCAVVVSVDFSYPLFINQSVKRASYY